MVEVVIAWKGKSMGKFELGRAPSFECHFLTSWERKTPRTICQFGSCISNSFWIHVLGDAGRLAHPSLFSIRLEALQ